MSDLSFNTGDIVYHVDRKTIAVITSEVHHMSEHGYNVTDIYDTVTKRKYRDCDYYTRYLRHAKNSEVKLHERQYQS